MGLGSFMAGRRFAFVALLGLLATGSQSASDIFRFDGPRALELGLLPVATELVDLDGDHDLDLVVVNTGWFTDGQWTGSSVQVFLNPGDGYFEASTSFPVPNGPRNLAVCDVNSDGLFDVVTPNTAADNLSVLLGDGAGGFVPGDVIPVGADPVDVVCLDFDGDDDADLASADRFSLGVSVAANAGDGTFGTPVFYPLGLLTLGVEGGDPDGDGDVDLLAFTEFDTFIFRNGGDGVFSTSALPDLETAASWSRLCRVDGDEHLDLVSGSTVWFGAGNGKFGPTHVDTGLSESPVLCCDFDRDGDLDVLTGSGIATSGGDGSFEGVTSLPPARDVGAVACGNFMDDVSIDLVRVQGTAATEYGVPAGYVTLIPGNDAASPSLLQRYPAGDSVWALTAGHVDGDEHLDVVVGNVGTPVSTYENGSVAVLAGNGDGTLKPMVAYPAGDRVRALALADIDGDSDLDAVVGNFDDAAVRVLPNDGTGVFGQGATSLALMNPEAIAVADFDGRNGPDLAVGNLVDSGTVAILLADGLGGYAPPAAQLLPGNRVIDIVAAQIDGDPHSDLAVLSIGNPGATSPWPNSGVMVLSGNGDGTFATPVLLATTAHNPRALDVCDVDGDTDLDLLVLTSGKLGDTTLMDARLEVRTNDGAGGFAAPVVTSFTTHAFDMRCGDINGDGHVDAVIPHFESSVVIFLAGNGDGTFDGPFHFETGPGSWALDLGDFDGDGETDLAVAHENSNEVTVLANRCAEPFTVKVGPTRSSVVWTPACRAVSYNVYRGNLSDLVDANGDSLPDSGYGTCVNDLDDSPDTVFDRVFSDETVPPLSEGFYYLVGFVGPSGEGGLGTTSGGLVRSASVPCP